jgi:uncharacterized protein
MTKHQFKILSIDGGGIKGIIPCMILDYIEKKVNTNRISDNFDLFAGTSTGGIIALGLTTKKPNENTPYTAAEMLDLYEQHGKDIFKERAEAQHRYWFIGKSELGQKPYTATPLESLLNQKFYDAKLSDSVKDIIITSHDIITAMPFYFQSRLAKIEKTNNTQPVIENHFIKTVARSTSAAPTFFNPSEVDIDGQKTALVDGGVFANNPALIAYGEAKELWRISKKKKKTKSSNANTTEDNDDLPFFMLSIGTGNTKKSISLEDVKDKITKNWLEHLLKNVLMEGVAESTHYVMQHILPNYEGGEPRYIRLNVDIPEEYSQMDNISDENIEALKNIAEAYINQNKEKLSLIADIISGRPNSEKWELFKTNIA